MKTKWIILTVAIGLAWNGFAQPPRGGNLDQKKEQIKQERKAFINRWTGFTEAEAEKFWKLHDEMDEKMTSARKESKTALKKVKTTGIDNLSDDELKKTMETQHNSEQKQLDIRWEYNQKFIDAVGVKKTARFYEGSRMFKKQLLERIRSGKQGGNEDGEDEGDE